jgi:Raf kinase inhibitor-like YbhB/YbcL family protein
MKKQLLNCILSGLLFFAFNSNAIVIESEDISEGERMSAKFEFNGFGCQGENKTPSISWHSLPEGTKSVAVTVFDPDAPTESGFWHWLVVNIPTNIDNTNLLSKDSGNGLTVRNDFGQFQFDGACPPVDDGMHRYQITVWALPVVALEVTKNTPAAIIGFMLNAMALDREKLTTTYVRTSSNDSQ